MARRSCGVGVDCAWEDFAVGCGSAAVAGTAVGYAAVAGSAGDGCSCDVCWRSEALAAQMMRNAQQKV